MAMPVTRYAKSGDVQDKVLRRPIEITPNFGHVAAWRRDASGTYLDGIGRRSSSGSLAKLTTIRRASSLVSSLAVDCRPGSSSK